MPRSSCNQPCLAACGGDGESQGAGVSWDTPQWGWGAAGGVVLTGGSRGHSLSQDRVGGERAGWPPEGHTHTHTLSHIHTFTHVYSQILTHTLCETYTLSDTQNAHIRVPTFICTFTHTHTFICSYSIHLTMLSHTCSHAFTHVHVHIHMFTQILKHICTYVHTHSHIHILLHSFKNTNVHTI